MWVHTRVARVFTLAHADASLPQELWLYVRKDNGYGALVRRAGRILLTVSVQPQLDGTDKVAVYTMNGTTLFEKSYGSRDECRVLELRNELIPYMVRHDKCTHMCKVDLVKSGGDGKALRGSVVLKPNQHKDPPRKLWFPDPSPGKRQTTIRMYMKGFKYKTLKRTKQMREEGNLTLPTRACKCGHPSLRSQDAVTIPHP